MAYWRNVPRVRPPHVIIVSDLDGDHSELLIVHKGGIS